MTAILLDHICKSFSATQIALDDVSLSVAPGECLAIVGPSGCGKTTLLRIIAGLESPTAGGVSIGGQSADHLACHQRDVAMLFQRPALVGNQTVRQNLRWPWTLRRPWLRFFGVDREREAALDQLASELGLASDLDRPVQRLSGGQQQRVALARCLLRQAKICLLDEPLGNLDAPLRTALRRLIRELGKKQSVTMLFVTHDPGEAFAVGDRVAVMQAGRVVQVDQPTALLRQPMHRFVAELAHHDRGGLNTLAGHLDAGTFVGPFGRWRVPEDKFSAEPKKLPSQAGASYMIMGIGATSIVCSHMDAARADLIQVTLPVVGHEPSTNGTWVIGRDERGQLIGRANGEERFAIGENVTMTFSMQDVYGFNGVTGQTMWLPG
jgi:ABC-type sugar transport system ATPase subunit